MTPQPARPTLYEDREFRQVVGPTLRPGGLGLTDRAMAACALPPGARVLDIGCGTGVSVERLRQAWKLRASGLDSSEALLGEGRMRHPSLPLTRGTAECLPFAGSVFDAVLSECVLSLVPYPDEALAEFARVLADGGRLALTDLYLRGPAPLPDGCAAPPRASCLDGAMCRDDLIGLLAESGFDVLVFEDHSHLLAELAARMVFAGIPPARLLGERAQASACRSGAGRGAGFGYFLLIATKRGS